jgi:hypothetical protein
MSTGRHHRFDMAIDPAQARRLPKVLFFVPLVGAISPDA